jgi:hypothetical protein
MKESPNQDYEQAAPAPNDSTDKGYGSDPLNWFFQLQIRRFHYPLCLTTAHFQYGTSLQPFTPAQPAPFA